MTDVLIRTPDLAVRLGDPGLRVVDATWYLPPAPQTGRQAHEAAHIPGAVFFDIDEIADRASRLPHMLPSPEAFAEAAGRLGLPREAEIVVYDAQGMFSAPRVWWMLKTMGYPNVRVLDGGLPAWRAQGLPVESGRSEPQAASVDPRFEPRAVAGLADVRQALGSAQVVDARPAARFRGEAPEPRPGLKSGHMPGARNLPWSAVLAEDATLKPPAELRAAFEAAGVDLSRPIVTSCGSGVSAAVLALALARLGRDDVAVYDGSWAEWGGRDDTPVVTGP